MGLIIRNRQQDVRPGRRGRRPVEDEKAETNRQFHAQQVHTRLLIPHSGPEIQPAMRPQGAYAGAVTWRRAIMRSSCRAFAGARTFQSLLK